jgi:hypothetical protein
VLLNYRQHPIDIVLRLCLSRLAGDELPEFDIRSVYVNSSAFWSALHEDSIDGV